MRLRSLFVLRSPIAICVCVMIASVASAVVAPALADAQTPAYRTRRALTSAEKEKLYKTLLPAMADGYANETNIAENRVVELGLPVVAPLVDALECRTLLRELAARDALVKLQPLIERDVQEWLTAYTDRIPDVRPIANWIDEFRFQDGGAGADVRLTSVEIRDAYGRLITIVQDVFENRRPDDIPPPNVLHDLRGRMLRAMGRIGDNSCADAVSAACREPFRPVIIGALRALEDLRPDGDVHGPAAYPHLFSDEIQVRTSAQSAIRAMNYSDAVDDLLSAWRDGPEDEQIGRIIEGLEGITHRAHGRNLGKWATWWGEVRNGDDPLGLG